MNNTDTKLYKINLNVVGEEPKQIWIRSASEEEARKHIDYNTHPRITVHNIEKGGTPKDGETIHTISDGEVETTRY
jgi:hypothetical protein